MSSVLTETQLFPGSQRVLGSIDPDSVLKMAGHCGLLLWCTITFLYSCPNYSGHNRLFRSTDRQKPVRNKLIFQILNYLHLPVQSLLLVSLLPNLLIYAYESLVYCYPYIPLSFYWLLKEKCVRAPSWRVLLNISHWQWNQPFMLTI